MGSLYIVKQVIVLFLIIVCGYYASNANIIDEYTNTHISDLIVKITLPMLILTSFEVEYSIEVILVVLKIMLFSIIAFGISLILSKFLFIQFSEDKKDILKFISVFSNCGFIGFPILKIIYGDQGILYASIFNLVYHLFVWTIGIKIYKNEDKSFNLRKMIINPNIIAVFIGIILMVFSLKLPSFIKSTCEMVGSMTVPLSMIVIGVMLSRINLKEILNDYSLYYISFFRLIGIPLLIYLILTVMKVELFITNIVVICEAMPGATLCPILAKNYGRNYEYASKVVVLSTLLSMITIPSMALLLKI